MKTFAKLFFENNAFIIHNELLKWNIWTNQSNRLLKNSRIDIEFYFKLFIVTKHGLFIVIKHGLKNEIIKLNVFFFWWNCYHMVLMNFWRIKIGPCFQKSFWILFFSFIKFFVPNRYIIEIFKWFFILMEFIGFLFLGFSNGFYHTN
jgi:hypothetical protein